MDKVDPCGRQQSGLRWVGECVCLRDAASPACPEMDKVDPCGRQQSVLGWVGECVCCVPSLSALEWTRLGGWVFVLSSKPVCSGMDAVDPRGRQQSGLG